MKKLLGYCAHLASRRLHEVAVGLLQDGSLECWEPTIERHGSSDRVPTMLPLELSEFAPRLSAAIDWGRDRFNNWRKK